MEVNPEGYTVTALHLTGPTLLLCGSLPASWQFLTGLTALHVSASPGLTGTLPGEWSQLTGLKHLSLLGFPGLGGTLPSARSTVQSMEVLDLSSIALTGPLPPNWSALRDLQVLNLSSNALTGTTYWGPAWFSLVNCVQLGGLSFCLLHPTWW